MDTKTAKVIARFHRMVPDGESRERPQNFEINQEITEATEIIDQWVELGLVVET